MSLKAFLLCAGLGERFYPHTHILPKVLLPFLNIPLISYNLFLLKTLKVGQCIANTHKHSRLIARSLKQQSFLLNLLNPVLSHETKLLGSAGGLLRARSFLENENHFYYLNGDTMMWPHKKEGLLNFYMTHVESKALASFLCTPMNKTQGVIWSNAKGQITSFLKRIDSKDTSFHFCGLALFSKEIFQFIKPGDKHIFKDVLEDLCSKEKMRIHQLANLEVLDMNQLSTYLKAHRLALHLLLEKPALSGFLKEVLNVFSPHWSRFQGDHYLSATRVLNPPESKKDILFCGKAVKGLNNISVKDFAVLGNYCQVKSPCQMLRSVAGNSLILDHSLDSQLLI